MRTPFFYGWVIVGLSGLTWTLATGLFNVGGVFLKPVAAEFGWARGTISGAFSLNALLAGALAVAAGAITDRYGPRMVMIGGGLLVALSLALLSRLESLWQFYLLWALFGIGQAAFYAPPAATVSRWFAKRKGLALGITTAGAGAGAVILPPFATYLIGQTGWRTAFFLLGLLAGVTFTALALGMRKQPQDMGLQPYGGAERERMAATPEQGFTLSQALRTQALWWVVLATILSIAAYGTITVHIIPYATDLGISPIAAASLISALGIAVVMGRLSWGAVADRIGSRRTLSFCFILAALPFFFLPQASSYISLLLLAALFGFAQGGFTPNWYGLMGELFGTASIGAIMGASEAGASTGWGVGAALSGYIFDVTRSYSWAFLSSALGLLLATGLILTLKTPRRRNE